MKNPLVNQFFTDIAGNRIDERQADLQGVVVEKMPQIKRNRTKEGQQQTIKLLKKRAEQLQNATI